MWHAYVRTCWKTTKDVYLLYVYIYQWLQNSTGRMQERVPCECTKANIQSYYEFSVDRRSQHESNQLTVSCSALSFSFSLPHTPHFFLRHGLFIFNTLRSTPYSLPIHNPYFPLWSQHYLLRFRASCWMLPSLQTFTFKPSKKVFFCCCFFHPVYQLLTRFDHVCFFPHCFFAFTLSTLSYS